MSVDQAKDQAKEQGLNTFFFSEEREPHAARRAEILKKYPQIKDLMGHDPNFKWVVMLVMSIQMATAYFVRNLPTAQFLLAVYVIGGTCTNNLTLAMHELSHNLGFKKMQHNRLFSIFVNLPLAVPSAITFKRYHMEHHRQMGEEGIDVDIFTEVEAKYLLSSTLGRLFYVMFTIFFYAVRPLIVRPKVPSKWEFINVFACVSFNLLVLFAWGPWALAYLLMSSLLACSVHPVAGHFLSEHYMFDDSTETYSYYGWMNILAYNVGYHNEHHDFPFIPGSRLPKVKEIAPEFYEGLPQTESWAGVMLDFILGPNSTGYRRMKRSPA